MRKPAFCICENKDADQLPGNRGLYYAFQAANNKSPDQTADARADLGLSCLYIHKGSVFISDFGRRKC